MPRPHPLLLDIAAQRPPDRQSVGDVEGLLASAFEHRMHGLLLSAAIHGHIVLPRDAVRKLALEDLAVQAHHRRLWTALEDVQERLGRISVQVAAAKGVTAEARWYGRLAERPCKDLDILLDPSATHRLEEIIDALQPDYFLRDTGARLMKRGMLQSLDLVVDGIAVDLHSDLLKIEIPTKESKRIWSRTGEVCGPSGTAVRAVDAETSLVHFLIHLHKDRFARLLGFADVVRLMAHAPLDWGFIDDFLAAEGLKVHVYSALHRVTSTLGLPTPPTPRPHGWRAKAWQQLWPDSQSLMGDPGFSARLEHRHFWIPWLAEGRMIESFGWWVRRRVFPPTALVDLYYPDTAGPYLVRVAVGRVRRSRERRLRRNNPRVRR